MIGTFSSSVFEESHKNEIVENQVWAKRNINA